MLHGAVHRRAQGLMFLDVTVHLPSWIVSSFGSHAVVEPGYMQPSSSVLRICFCVSAERGEGNVSI